MRRNSTTMVVLSVLLVSFAMLSAHAADVDASGAWQLTVLDTGRTFTPNFTLKQNGDQLTGTYKNSMGDNPASGTVKGDAVTLNAEITGQDGQKRTVTYVGTVKGNSMTGKLQTTRADVTFTATRQ
jgi:hypothetical protein